LYEDFFKDERNTDNAWIEIAIHHFHDDKGALAKYLVLKNDGSHGSCWLPISQKTPHREWGLVSNRLAEGANGKP
ncbi:NDX6-like protein, partial [Mya arenaria]